MTTPIYDFILQYINSDFSRLHMPGHKGHSPFMSCITGRMPNIKGMASQEDVFSVVSAFDITEITNADELYDADGIIAESEENTALLYGSKHTSFSAGGSTLCIQAMVRLVANEGDTIIAARNVHGSFINACALLNVTPYFVLPEFNNNFFVSGGIKPKAIEDAIKLNPNAKAVYITSPDYLGCMSDVKGIADVCKNNNIPLVVDNAHGAHLKFTPNDMHPITLGASICCDSAHKTLPVFTGGAYIHVSKHSNITKEEVKSAMVLFGSTSPSYLIMTSLDLNNLYLEKKAKDDFKQLAKTVFKINAIASEKGFTTIDINYDITKLTFDAYQVGMTGEELKHHFQTYHIEPEYVAMRHVVLMLSPQNTKRDIERIIDAIHAIEPKPMLEDELMYTHIPNQVMSIRTAILNNKMKVSVDQAIGKIAAEVKIKCPPGVPIVIPGEIIDEYTQKLLKKSSIFTINVVK